MSYTPSDDALSNAGKLAEAATDNRQTNQIDYPIHTSQDEIQNRVKPNFENDPFMKDNDKTQNVQEGISFPSMTNVNSQDDSHSSMNLVTEPFAQGLIKFLTPVIQEMDGQIDSVKSSQIELQKVIERLLNELQLFVDTNQPPYILPSVQKLINARKRLTTVNSTLKLVQDRLDRLLTQIE